MSHIKRFLKTYGAPVVSVTAVVTLGLLTGFGALPFTLGLALAASIAVCVPLLTAILTLAPGFTSWMRPKLSKTKQDSSASTKPEAAAKPEATAKKQPTYDELRDGAIAAYTAYATALSAEIELIKEAIRNGSQKISNTLIEEVRRERQADLDEAEDARRTLFNDPSNKEGQSLSKLGRAIGLLKSLTAEANKRIASLNSSLKKDESTSEAAKSETVVVPAKPVGVSEQGSDKAKKWAVVPFVAKLSPTVKLVDKPSTTFMLDAIQSEYIRLQAIKSMQAEQVKTEVVSEPTTTTTTTPTTTAVTHVEDISDEDISDDEMADFYNSIRPS